MVNGSSARHWEETAWYRSTQSHSDVYDMVSWPVSVPFARDLTHPHLSHLCEASSVPLSPYSVGTSNLVGVLSTLRQDRPVWGEVWKVCDEFTRDKEMQAYV